MTLKTSRDNVYEIQWADVASKTGYLYIEMEDKRKLSEIAVEFEDLSWLKREDNNQGNKLFEGFNQLKIINRTGPSLVMLTLTKGAE